MPAGFTPDKSILDGAKREGALLWHSAWPTDNTALIVAEFSRRFPFVKFTGIRSPYAFPKLQQERQAGKFEIDIIGPTTATTVHRHAEQGYFASYQSPTAGKLSQEYWDPQGRWFATHSMGICFAYNTKLVPSERRPKTWPDLLTPYWSGKTIMEDGRYWGTNFEWFVGVYTTVGEQWFRDLAKHKLDWFIEGSVTHALDDLAAGTHALAPWAVDYMVQQRTDRGEPIAWENPTRIGRIPAFAISAGAPHPNAARLFLDWLLSEDCQRIIGEKNLGMPALPSVPSYMAKFYPPNTRLKINTPAVIVKELPKYRQLFIDIFFNGQDVKK